LGGWWAIAPLPDGPKRMGHGLVGGGNFPNQGGAGLDVAADYFHFITGERSLFTELTEEPFHEAGIILTEDGGGLGTFDQRPDLT